MKKISNEKLLQLIEDKIVENPSMYPEILKVASFAFTNYKNKLDIGFSSIHFFINFLPKAIKKKILSRVNKEMFPDFIIKKLKEGKTKNV
jgi:hypothetical protein